VTVACQPVGRFRWLDLVVTEGGSEFDSTERNVMLALLKYMNRDGFCHVSKPTILRGTGLRSERAVDDAVKRLEATGWLIVYRSKGGRPGGTYRENGYQAAAPDRTPHDDAGIEHDEPRTATRGSGENEGGTKGARTPHHRAPEAVEAVEPTHPGVSRGTPRTATTGGAGGGLEQLDYPGYLEQLHTRTP
jgi:hypothetical protein